MHVVPTCTCTVHVHVGSASLCIVHVHVYQSQNTIHSLSACGNLTKQKWRGNHIHVEREVWFLIHHHSN